MIYTQYNVLFCHDLKKILIQYLSFSGYLTTFVEMGNFAGLRTFRVLRALKSVSIMPGSNLNIMLSFYFNSIIKAVPCV